MADFFENCLLVLRRAVQTNFNGKQSDAAIAWYKSLIGIILRSANKLYHDITVSGPDLESLVIHGRVCWCGRMM